MNKIKKIHFLLSFLLIANLYPAGFCMSSEKELNNIKSDESISSSVSVNQETTVDLSEKCNNLVLKNQKLMEENQELKNEVFKLKQDNSRLKSNCDKYEKRMKHYKRKYDEKKEYISPEQAQNEVEKVKAQMTLEFARYMGEYIKDNPKKKMRNFDMRGLFSNFINFNVNYHNKGDTTFSPLAIKGEAKAAAGGAALAV